MSVNTPSNMDIYPFLTFVLASFVTYCGYCAYRNSRQQEYKKCSYTQFESRLMEILHREASKRSSYLELCELSTPAVRRDFFMKKIESANKSIMSGDPDASIDLFIEAMAICSRPAELLHCMSKTLPLSVYRKLIEKLSTLS